MNSPAGRQAGRQAVKEQGTTVVLQHQGKNYRDGE